MYTIYFSFCHRSALIRSSTISFIREILRHRPPKLLPCRPQPGRYQVSLNRHITALHIAIFASHLHISDASHLSNTRKNVILRDATHTSCNSKYIFLFHLLHIHDCSALSSSLTNIVHCTFSPQAQQESRRLDFNPCKRVDRRHHVSLNRQITVKDNTGLSSLRAVERPSVLAERMGEIKSL